MFSSVRLGGRGLARGLYLHHQAPSSRLLSSSPSLLQSELAKLRKKTGYSLSICKKALGETGTDGEAAEKWLAEQAQALGLAKASKLQGRNTSQGLLGLRVKGGTAALVELNCETDFVARNQKFLTLLEEVSDACLKVDGGDGSSTISGEQVGALTDREGRSLSDLVALNIGQIGENLALGNATLVKAGEGEAICGLCHPSSGASGDVQYGRYAALLSLKGKAAQDADATSSIARGICQHIIGLAPLHISNIEDKENSLMHQSYLLDEEQKVSEVLESAGLEVTNFVRVEVGRSGA
jgi:elongation factor Ts